MEESGRGRRKCPRIPVYLDVRLDLKDGTTIRGKIINLSTEGICVKTEDPLFAEEEIAVEFLLPDTLTSVRLGGEAVWYRFDHNVEEEKDPLHFSGIRFIDLKESYRSLIRYFTLKMLHDVELIREQGIDRVLSDILNLPLKERETALSILAQKGFITDEQRKHLSSAE